MAYDCIARTFAVALLLAVALSACQRSTAEQTAYMRNMTVTVTPLPTDSPAPTYVAVDAGKPGQPALTAAEAAKVRSVLNEIRPCQRPLLRYAFPGADQPVHFAVFFRLENGMDESHIFGTRWFYRWRGDVGYPPGPRPRDPDAVAIKEQQCKR